MKKQTLINITEIENLFREYCDDNKVKFSENKFEDFLEFLEIDFYDWVKQNLKYFYTF
jgi:hypothetical protein